MSSIKEATQSAMAFAVEALGPERTHGLRLEEVEAGDGIWRITLSMLSVPDPSEATNIVAAISALSATPRDYKVFTVKKISGEVLSMKMREMPKR